MNKPNEKLEVLAIEILGSQKDLPEEKFGSVIMILMMVSIILTTMRVLQECNKNNKQDKILVYKQHIKEICERRGWFSKMKLRKILRRELNQEDYKLYARSLTQAIFDKGENITDEEVLTLLEASNV